MKRSELPFISIRDASDALKERSISPVDIVEAVLDRIRRLNGLLNAYISVYEEDAMEEARKAEERVRSGDTDSVLQGIPVSIKDIIHIKGRITTAGSKVMRDYVAKYDADVVSRLKGSNAVIIGKTNLHEFAYGATNVVSFFGPARNPWDVSRMSGGSSGGSASAVAAGMCMASLGTDTGGSIRIPSSLCGVFGLKPTYGRISTHGVIPLAWSLDHVGIIARTAWDLGAMLEVLSDGNGFSMERARGLMSRRFRVGIPSEKFLEPLDEDVEKAFWNSVGRMEDNGWKVERLEFDKFEQLGICRYIILLSEAASFHYRLFKERHSDYSQELRKRIVLGMLIPTEVYIKAQRTRSVLVEYFLRAMKEFDILVCPTTPVAAPKLDAEEVCIKDVRMGVRVALLRLTEPFNALGFPALSAPCGKTREGLPVGLQLVAKPYMEGQLLAATMCLEESGVCAYERPPV